MKHKKLPKVVIIGAGFGGITIAKSFKNKPIDVLLIDQNNYHNFQPLMYQIATGGLEPDSIAYPVRRIFRKYKNVRFRMAKVYRVAPRKKKLKTSIGNIAYDYLVIATGSENNFFNFDSVKNNLLSLKSIPDALNLRSFIFQNLERSLVVKRSGEKTLLMNIAIVGGGPAGVELAGAIAEMKRYVIPKDFPELDLSKMHINLYQSSSKVLNAMSDEASSKTLIYLRKMGVNVHLNSRASSYNGSILSLEDGTTFSTETVIWTAGVKAAPIRGLAEKSIIGGNRIEVDKFNQVLDEESIFAIGDVAAHITKENPNGLPMLAPVAKQQGKLLSKNLLRLTQNKPLEAFYYKNNGIMATIGRKKAVVDLPSWKFQGTFAWMVWMFVHIMSLVGFRNKAAAFIGWMLNYLTYDRPLGLILRPYYKSKK